MSQLHVPASFDEITAPWFDAALSEGSSLEVSVASINVEPMHASKGLIGDLATINVTYSKGVGPESFVVKLPAENPDSRRIGEALRAYEREVAFYRHVAPLSAGTRLPQCFYAAEDIEASRWVLILESIEADEFDFFAGATHEQAHAAIDALADFHAAWWDSHRIFDWMPGFDAAGVGVLQPMWLANLPTFIDRYRDVLPGQTADWVTDFAPTLGEWCRVTATEPLTMVHADYRIDNLLFQGERVTMIDWQTAMRAPAAMDLSCFISTSLDIGMRQEFEDSLIDRYLGRLSRTVSNVDHNWFLRSYDQNLLWWMGQFGNNLAHLDPGDELTQAGLTTMVQRVYTTAHDRDVGRLLY